ncbi:MAG: ABC transporter substrate-binding protein [Candidatus Methylomirabilales bacterium]
MRGKGSAVGVLILMLGLVFLVKPVEAQKPVKVAMVNSTSGPAALYGVAGIEGAKIAVDELNAVGGLLGRPIELIVKDDAAKPDIGAREMRSVITREEVAVVFGPVSSAVLLAMSEVAKENKTILIAHTSNTERAFWERGHKYIFSVVPNTYIEGAAMGAYMAKKPYKRYYIIGPDYEFGHIQAAAFERKLKELKPDVEIIGKIWPKLGEKDYTSYITAILAAKPDAVYSNLWGSDLVAFTKQAKPYGFFEKFPFAALYDVDVLQALGKDAVEGVIGYERGPFHAIRKLAPSERFEAFFKKYRERTGGKYPSCWAVIAYDAVMAWAKAVKKANSFETEAVVKALEGLELDSLRGKGIVIHPYHHQASVPEYIGVVKWDPKFKDFALWKDVTAIPGDKVWRSEAEIREIRKKAGVE